MSVIPPKDSKIFNQPNTGDTQGNLWSTFNIDLTENKGKIRTTRTIDVQDTIDANFAGMLTASAFAFFNPGGAYSSAPVFIAYGGRPWYGSSRPDSGWTNTVIGGNEPTSTNTDVDMKVFNGKLYATTSDNYLKRMATAGAWTNIASIGTGIHILCNYKDHLYWSEGNFNIHSINYAETVITSSNYTFTVPNIDGHISWMAAGSNRIWIGWTSNDGTRGSIFDWDGVSLVASREYKIEAQGSCTCVIKNDIPYVLDIEGRLLAFNGSNFQEVARLPIANTSTPIISGVANTSQKLAHFNGSLLVNDKLLFLINPIQAYQEPYLENCLPGIWEYTEETGLYHKYSVSTSTLADSPEFDYGQQSLIFAGALFDATISKTGTVFPSSRQGSVLFGARAYRTTISSPVLLGVDNTLDDIKKSAYITTSWLESSQVEDVWKSIVVKYNKLLNTTDKIKVKYRTIKRDASYISVNWTSSTTFTTSSADMANYEIGNEVELALGAGAGKVVNISNISYSNPTYTVTVDEATQATGSLNVRLQKWYKLPEITNTLQFANLPLPQYNKDTKIQFKIIMEFTGKNEVEELMVINGTEQNAK